MKPRILVPLQLLGLALCMPPLAGAENRPKPRATPVHHHTLIQSISADSITVSQPGGAKTYKITSNTEITFKGQTTTTDKLQAGMRVTVTPDAADESVAGQIAANDPPKDESPKPKK